jgi:hypothetical protein
LNLIWFDSFKIRANLARFQTPTDFREKTALTTKSKIRANLARFQTPTDFREKTALTTKPETKISPKLALRDNKTFVEALLVQQPSKKTVVSLHRMTRNGY